jgi:malonyl-CoA O-methyltransferase
MEERLQWITLQPQSWLHWEPLRGGLEIHQALCKRYPLADCAVIESDAGHARVVQAELAQPWWAPKRWLGAKTRFEMPAPGNVNMLWANMALHVSAQPQSLLASWQRLLAVDGFLMFSCLGPDTLRELRILFADLHWPTPTHEFTDMHDWGDMLVRAGFAEPVMDMERITLTFETPERLLQELRALGRNLNRDRFPALRGRQWRDQLHRELRSRLAGADGRLSLTFEIIYGHALKAAPRLSVQPQTTLTLDQMRESLSRNRR